MSEKVDALKHTEPMKRNRLTSEELSAWEVVERYTKLVQDKNWDGFFECFHEEFCGWLSLRSTPNGKVSRQKWVPFAYQSVEVLEYELDPLAVNVYGDVAICHYATMKVKKSPAGVEIVREHMTDILKKENDRWLLIGDAGGPRPRSG